MRLLSYSLFAFLFSSALNANAQTADSTNADQAVFPDIPFISAKDIFDVTPSTPRPRYPLDARRKGICGDVLIALKIGEDGKVLDTKILKSEPSGVFDKAVTEVIGKWRYKRVTFNGEPVVYQTKSPFKFRLDGPDCYPNPAVRP